MVLLAGVEPMLFAEAPEGFSGVIQEYLPFLVGMVVSAGVLIYLALRGWKLREEPQETTSIPPNMASFVAKEKADKWEVPETSYADRRGSIRRDGPPVRVILQSPTFRNGVDDGLVVDRSTGGLRLLSKSAVPEGSTVQVRAVNAPDTVGFVVLVVRSCRENEDFFELGCEFTKTPPWNVLLLFG
jgi:hypothetical protein